MLLGQIANSLLQKKHYLKVSVQLSTPVSLVAMLKVGPLSYWPVFFGMTSLLFRHLDASSTLVFTCLALLVLAVAQAANKMISFYNPIIAIHLCFLHALSSLFILKVSSWIDRKSMAKTLVGLAIFECVLCISLAMWAIYVYVIGYQPQCGLSVRSSILPFFGEWPTFNDSGSLPFWRIILYRLHQCHSLPPRCSFTSIRCQTHWKGSVSWITRIDAINNPYGRKVVSLLFVSIWIYAVIAIEETVLHNLVPHDTPQSMISFSQVRANSSLRSHLIIFLTTRIGFSYCHNWDPYRVYLSRRNGLVAT